MSSVPKCQATITGENFSAIFEGLLLGRTAIYGAQLCIVAVQLAKPRIGNTRLTARPT